MRCTATAGRQVHQHIYATSYMSRVLCKASITFTPLPRQRQKSTSQKEFFTIKTKTKRKEFITCQKNLILNTKPALSAVL